MNCTICLGKYDKQMLLPTTCMPCCHNFCLTCLKELKKRDSKIICPECRQNVQSVKPCFEIIGKRSLIFLIKTLKNDTIPYFKLRFIGTRCQF